MPSSVRPGTDRRDGGRLIAERLRAHGVSRLFTLSGGHLFPLFDGCRHAGIDLVDVRHESTAAFAAEGWAKVTREPGVAALTAGPGVTNGIGALASAQQNHTPMLVLGGRAPHARWGQGSLREIDHVPLVRPLVKVAATARRTAEIPGLVDDAFARARRPHSGPAFLDFPLDVLCSEAEPPAQRAPASEPAPHASADATQVDRAVVLLRDAERPVIVAGTNLYWGRGEAALTALSEEAGIPVFLDGLARGCLPADHDNFFSRSRSEALREADAALLIGVPMDFRLGLGRALGERTQIVMADVADPVHIHPRPVAAELYGALPPTLDALREGVHGRDTSPWLRTLRRCETEKRVTEREELEDDRAPLHPMRVFGELSRLLDRNAVIVSDGGAFDSYAGRAIDSYQPGCWVDRGPFGCLGAGPGYALAAKLAHPDRQVVLLLGDGAFGLSGMEFDTLARHGVNVIGVMGNNGMLALEHHPMTSLYGYSVAAELRHATRYDQVVEALGCHGELVERPEELRQALERAFAADSPALVNVLTDPGIVVQHRSLVDRVIEVRGAAPRSRR
jgi:thiamine pyrophosphate-dependent acetolactate synthase large subunit-like protein